MAQPVAKLRYKSKTVVSAERTTERPQGTRRSKTWTVVGCLLLVVATVAVYSQVNYHPFLIYDDQDYVTNNVHIRQGLDWESVKWSFTTYANGNWHPLTWFSHILDFQLFGLNPAGHHDVNLLLHVINVLLLFWVLWRATGYPGRSLMVAALFALHPINVESVAWVAERKNLLSMFFFLLALGAYRWYASSPRAGRYSTVAVLYACGLMAKPQVITLPFVLLLWDYLPLRRMASDGEEAPHDFPARKFSSLLLEKVPLCALSAASAIVTLKAQRAGGALSATTWHLRLENAIVSYVRYLGKAFWPSHLAPMYVHPEYSLTIAQVAGALALLLAVTTLVWLGRKRGYLPVGWLWFLGTLVPMIGVVQVGSQAMADRYAYLPFVGLFIMVCWGVSDALLLAPGREESKIRAGKQRGLVATQAGIGIAALLVLMVLTYRQVGRWKDEVTLWQYTLQVTSNNYVAEGNLGVALEKEGRPIDAMPHFFRAVALHPADTTGNVEIAMYYQRAGMLREAIAQYQKMLTLPLAPDPRAEILNNIGFDSGSLGDYALARKSFEEAVKDNPNHSRAWMGLGVLNQRSGDLSHAIEDYSHSLEGHPSDVTYLLLARALQQSGRDAEARTAMQHSSLLSPDMNRTQQIADSLLGPASR